jgi:hypothetical protein
MVYLGSGARIVDSGGIEYAAAAVDDESTVIVSNIERFEKVGRYEGELDN